MADAPFPDPPAFDGISAKGGHARAFAKPIALQETIGMNPLGLSKFIYRLSAG